METKKKVKLLALQIGSIIGEKEKNISKVRSLLGKCLSKLKPDFVFLPEVWTVGWDCPSFKDCSEEIDSSSSIDMLKNISHLKQKNVWNH